MSLDKSKRAVLDKVFKAENPASVNFWKPSSDAADEVEWNAKIEREIADAKQSDKFKNERTRKQRIKFLEGARMPVPERYVSDLSDDKRALLEQVFGLNAGKQQETAQQAAPVPVWETEAPTSSMLSTKISDTPLETGQGPTPEQRMPMERFDMRAALNPVAVRSGVLLDPGTDGAPKAGDMVLPSGTVLRESDGDLDAFFREQVLPGIEPMQAAADERTRKELTAEGKARDRRWLEHFNIDPVGDYMADAVQAAATSRRERGPARIVEEVLSGVDPEKANAYIASRLADDPEFAAAANRLQGAVPDAEEMSEKEVEQLQAALSPAQRKQYEKAVAEEQKRIAREQGTFQKAADAAWKRQAQLFQEGITHRLVEEMARRNMPKSELSAFARIALNASIPGMLTEWAVSNTAGGDKTLHAQIMQRALEKYDPSIWTRMGGDVAGLLLGTPVFSAGGVLGKAGASVLRRAAERNVMKRLMARGITEGAEGVARRLVSGSMAQRLAQGAVASSATLGTYDAVAAPLAMAAAGENPNVWDVLGAMGRGVATGALLPGIGMATGKVAEAAGSRLGRYAAELGGFAAENAAFVGMGTLYDGIRTGEWGSPEQLAEDFAHSVGVLGTMKSVGALKRGRARNPGFYDKVIAETEFTPEEVEALGRAGVDGRSYKRAVFDLLNAKQSASGREIAERAAEQLGSRYTDVMRSPEVPVSAKAKLMYLLEGRVPARLPLTTNVRRTVGENGRTTVDLLDPAGNLVQRRTFSTEKAAEAFERESAGVREINAIQYYEALIDRVQTLDAATDAYAAECGVPVEAVKGEVRKAAEGQSHDRELVRRVMELSGQTGAGTLDVPGMLAAEIGRKHGLREGGFEQALSRREEVRTPEESAAVAEYAARLKEIATQELRPEPTPEERVERQLVEEAEQAIVQAQNRDDGVVYTATMQDGRQANIIKGANLVYDPETGEVNAAQSDPTVVVRYEDGTMRQVSVREIDMIVEAVSAGDARSEALRAIREQLDAAAREEALAAAVEAGGLVELKDGRIGAVEGVNEDGSYRVALQDGEGRILTEQVVAGDIAGPVAKEPAQEVEQPAGTAADPLLGRSLTAEEAGQVISEMEAAAVPVPELELTPENWVAQFGEQGKVQTPIGEVKMGENQLAKLFLKGRDRYFGMIKPTLTEPDMVLEKSAPDEKAERQSKYLFVKTFLKQDGSRFVYFESVTVSKNGMEVAISNHEADGQAIKKEMQNGKILHLSTKLSSGSDRYLTETPSREGPDLVPSSDNSLHKDTTTIPEKQAAEQDIPRLKNGQPDFNAMPTEMLAVELSAAVGHDKAVERLQVARGVNSKNMDKLHRTLDGMGDLNKAMAVEQRLETMRQEDARLAGALEQLGAVGEPVAGKASAENFSQEIERLFPEGLPNVRAQVLADIARGQRFVWNDSPDGTKRGVATELGFTGNESERRARFGMLGSEATGAKHLSRYLHDLWQDSNGYAFDMDDAALRDEVIDVLLTTPSRASAMEQLRAMAARTAEDAAAPRDAEDQAAAEAYEKQRRILSEQKNNGNFVERAFPETYGSDSRRVSGDNNGAISGLGDRSGIRVFEEGLAASYREHSDGSEGDRREAESERVVKSKKNGKGFNEDNDEPALASGNDGRRLADDGAGRVARVGDRGDIRVFEEGLDASYREHSDGSERDRREAESQRLVAVAKENGLYIDEKQLSQFGDKQSAKTGESVVYIDLQNGKVYKSKNPYAKTAIKGNMPEDAIFEHIIHNLLFPEAAYRFEGISEYLGDARIVLSQNLVRSAGQPTKTQIETALAQRGLYPENTYTFGNNLISVTDVEGDNVLLGADGQLYFIDPIIRLKKPAREVIDELSRARQVSNGDVGPEIGSVDVPFSVVSEAASAPAGVTPERWNVIVDQLRRVVGAEHVVIDPTAVRAAYDRIMQRSAETGRKQVAEAKERFNSKQGLFTNEESHYFRTPEGEVYGFTAGGTIYLDSERMNAASPMHEYTELWSQLVARENPELWMRGAGLLKQTLIWDDVNADPNYKNLSEELRVSETLARIVADEFAGKQAAITDSSALLGKLRAWMRKFWGFLKGTFAKWTKRELDDLTPEKFAQMPLRDFVEGIDLQKVRGPKPETQWGAGHKQLQLEVIERYNPMRDDVHTGIRSIEDIKSFEEVVQEAHLNGVTYPDMNTDMLDGAATTGRITVYSSYPIGQGVFVTPSKMNAQDYAREGRIYSKVVPVDDVAWIAQDEGQYAKVGKKVSDSDVRLSMNGEKARIREQALADGSYLKAPNGKPSRLTADQWETVRTRQFKKWFGDWENDPENASKMVDKNGEPQVYYHNTNASFHAFDKNKTGTSNDVGWLGDGFYFYGDITEGRGYGHLRMDVFLNVREPYYATSEDNARLAEANSRDVSVAFREELTSDGYDGVYYNGDLRQEAVVFDPEQIKSATENIGAFDPANPDIRFNREFTRRRVTTLEKLENKRAALIAERENIANFDEQMAAVEAQIEAYMQSDPVAETFRKDGSGAESQAHLQAVEDAVYDIVRKEGVEGVQVDVVQSAEALLEYARSNNWAKEDIEGIEQGILSRGYYSDDNVTILASLIKDRKIAAGVFWHERTHGITDELRTSDQLTQAAEQAGAELLDAALTKRGYSTEIYSMERMADEYVSRGVEILAKKGLLDDYLVTPEADIEPIEAYLAGRNVPELLREYIVESCQHIKNQKYGIQEGILLRAGDTCRAATNTGDQALRDRYNRTAVGTDAGVDGGGNVALRRGFSGSERLSAADDNEGGVRTADAVGVHPTRGGDLEHDSAPKLTKQQQLIADLRRAVRESKAAARSVAQIVSLRVRKEIGTELVEIMGKREFDALVRQIEQATARQEVEKPLQRIAEIVTDLEIKRLQKVVDKFLQLKVQGKGPRGVSVAKEVDDRTRRMFEIFRNNLDRPAKEVAAELREREDADMLYDLDAVSALEAYQEAMRYGREVDDIDREVEAMLAHTTKLRRERIAANKVGHKLLFETLKRAILHNKELIEALEAERVETKEHWAGALKETVGLLSGHIGYGREILSEWRKQEEVRRKKIVNTAFRDADDGSRIPVLDKQPGVWTRRYRRTMDFLLSPAYSMDYLLKMISVNAPKGEGALYDHFMRSKDGYVEARGRYYLGYEDFKRVLDEKARAMFGKSYLEVAAESNTPTASKINITNVIPGKKDRSVDPNSDVKSNTEHHIPTIGEALYIYMVNKMTDGQVKLKRMGIREEDVGALTGILPERFVQFADWLQNEFLPERRKIYNTTHLALFGTQMAQIENYVPLKIERSYTRKEVDGSEPDPNTLPSAITGSIIKRTRNNQILDLHTNALDLMLEHGQQMEHWNAFSRVVIDMNALLSSTAFRRMLETRSPGLHGRLKVAAQLAVGSYQPQTNDVNRAWIALGKLAASSKIAFRINTALKQVLSYPAFYAYSSDPKFWALLTKNLAPTTWAKDFRWCMENIPSFRERRLSRMVGNEKLAQMTAPAIDRWLDKMNRYGMIPNAFVDALTCANGAKAVYDFRRAEYLERGKSGAEAERLARIDAAVAINETQQSSEGMYIGQLQADRDFWSVSLSTFQNSNFAYLRKQLEGIDELFRDTVREQRNRKEYYKQQGFSEEEAFDRALKEVAEAKRGALLNIGVFMFGLNILWRLGNDVWKYLFAPETQDEIPGELAKSAVVATVRNTTVGSAVESFANGYDANPSVLLSDLVAFTNRLWRIVEKENPDAWNETAAYLTLQTLSANGLGIDLESFVNMYQGIAGMIRDGVDAEDLMRMLNAPQSQARLLAGKPKEGETEEEYRERMIFTERRIAERVDKKRRNKWTRNYTAYRQAEVLGIRAERDLHGNVTVPELKQLDAAYAEALKQSGMTAAGDMRKDYDWQGRTPEEQERWRKRARSVWKIREEEKALDTVIVYNERYAERMRRLMHRKRDYVDDVENNNNGIKWLK